ncbi:hypothetical protein MCEMRE196_00841 [Candidatus Nanopelagicaceae bacterium]
MAFIRRNKDRELTIRESNGENFWTYSISENVKKRILYVFKDSVDGNFLIYDRAHGAILRDLGVTHLTNARKASNIDFVDWCLEANDTHICEGIERFYEVISDHSIIGKLSLWNAAKFFEDGIRQILLEERISWDFVNGMMIHRDSQIAHSSILLPTLHLLTEVRFQESNKTFLKGLEELSKGDAGDAITDFATSLQIFLKAKGCVGGTLGALKNYGTGKVILNSQQARLIDLIADIRNEGEVHNPDRYQISDAWFMCHLVASLMLQMEKTYEVTPR